MNITSTPCAPPSTFPPCLHPAAAPPRRLLELNPGPKIAEQVRGVLATCDKAPTDVTKVNYDPRNPFDICSLTFSPIYKVRGHRARQGWGSTWGKAGMGWHQGAGHLGSLGNEGPAASGLHAQSWFSQPLAAC